MSNPYIKMLLKGNQMQRAGHLTRVQDVKLVKQLFSGELQHGRRAQGIKLLNVSIVSSKITSGLYVNTL